MARRIGQDQLYKIILERGFPEITKTIKKQVLQGVETHNLTFLEIGQIIWYAFEKKGLKVQPVYGLGPIYNIKKEALDFFRAMENETKQKENAMENRINDKTTKKITNIVPQERKFKRKHIDLEDI